MLLERQFVKMSTILLKAHNAILRELRFRSFENCRLFPEWKLGNPFAIGCSRSTNASIIAFVEDFGSFKLGKQPNKRLQPIALRFCSSAYIGQHL